MPNGKNYSGSQLPSYTDYSSGLPNGWKVETFLTKKNKVGDLLWCTKTKKRLRSRIEVKMFLYVLEINDGNEESAWQLFKWFRKNADLWQKVRKFCVQVESNEDGDGKETIDDTDVEEIKNKLLRIKAIVNEK